MTRCINAELGLRINTDGTCKHCCMQKENLKNSETGKEFKISSDKFIDILSSKHSLAIQTDLKNGIQHPACSLCWEEESSGKDSKRIRDNKQYSHLFDSSITAPSFLDVSMGTTCNIKCRTCGPFNSSQWNDEWQAAGYFKGTTDKYKIMLQSFNHSFDDDSLFWSEFENNIGNITHIDFYGGEPFLVKKQWDLMKSAVATGIAKNITVHYNTNGTVWDADKVDILKHFKAVNIDFSIDGIYDKLTYIRYPADWNTVFGNYLKLQEIEKKYPNFHSSVCCTVSTFNIYDIDEIMEFFSRYTKNLYLNLVHGPEHHCIKNIPESLKQKITDKLKNTVKKDWAGYYTFASTIEFMNGTACHMPKWDKFLKTTLWHDQYRQQDFKETFPKFYKLIKEENYEISMER